MEGHSIRQTKEFISTDILEIIKVSSLFSPEFYDRDSIIESVSEIKTLTSPGKLVSLPSEITKFQFLFNPVRLSIMKILSENTIYPSAEIRKLLGVSWGKYTPHLTAMEKEGYIISETEFVDSIPRKTVLAEPKGLKEYYALKDILYSLVFKPT